jgi:hypothetical protein
VVFLLGALGTVVFLAFILVSVATVMSIMDGLARTFILRDQR